MKLTFSSTSGSSFVSTSTIATTDLNYAYGYNLSTDTFLTDVSRITPVPGQCSSGSLVSFVGEDDTEETETTEEGAEEGTGFDEKWIIDVNQLSSDKKILLGQVS